jgi:F0F1-type ATP synthase assembly protein I
VVRGEAFAILSLLAMMLVAFAILRPVSDAARDAPPVHRVVDV